MAEEIAWILSGLVGEPNFVASTHIDVSLTGPSFQCSSGRRCARLRLARICTMIGECVPWCFWTDLRQGISWWVIGDDSFVLAVVL